MSVKEVWLIVWGVGFVMIFAAADDLSQVLFSDLQQQAMARLTVVTVLVIINGVLVMHSHRVLVRQLKGSVPALRVLNARERQVLGMLARAMTPHEISVILFIAEPTVQRTIENIMVKLDVRHTQDLVDWSAQLVDISRFFTT